MNPFGIYGYKNKHRIITKSRGWAIPRYDLKSICEMLLISHELSNRSFSISSAGVPRQSDITCQQRSFCFKMDSMIAHG